MYALFYHHLLCDGGSSWDASWNKRKTKKHKVKHANVFKRKNNSLLIWMASEIAQLDPKKNCVTAIYYLALLLIIVPPLIWLSPQLENQSSVICSIDDFHVTVLQSITNTTSQSVIHFDLKLQNKAVEMGAYYDNLTFTFSYVNTSSNDTNTTFIPLANYTVRGFHLGIDSETHRKDFLLVAGGADWVKNASEVVFRVGLETAVLFKDVFFSKSKRFKLLAEADVAVNATSGKKIRDKSIELKNLQEHPISGWAVSGSSYLWSFEFLQDLFF